MSQTRGLTALGEQILALGIELGLDFKRQGTQPFLAALEELLDPTLDLGEPVKPRDVSGRALDDV
jgi:hypothetical protein